MKNTRISGQPANPRKRPQQARSRLLTQALLIATSRVLERHGVDGATTARIAEVAGVSIGSLYQYFPNRAALIGALIDLEAEQFSAEIEALLAEQAHTPLAEAIDLLVTATLRSRRLSPALHALLNDLLPQVAREAAGMAAAERIVQALAAFFAGRAAQIAPIDPALAGLVVETVLEGLAHRAVRLEDAAMREAVAVESARLLKRYFRVDD